MMLKTKLLPHQEEGVDFGLGHDKFLLLDGMGLGKSLQAIALAFKRRELNGIKKCLIICGVNGLKWNWKAEIEKHSDCKGFILGSKVNRKGKTVVGGTPEKLEDVKRLKSIEDFFIITNVESLRDKNIAKELQKACTSKEIGMIVFDEIHTAKTPSSQQGKNLLKLKAPYMVGMTGTPITNSPLDLYIPLKWLDLINTSFYVYKQMFCIYGGYNDYQIIGYKDLGILQSIINVNSIRRFKDNVLDLPPKIVSQEYVEMDKEQRGIYTEVLTNLLDNIDKVSASVNPLAQLCRLRQATDWTGLLSETVQCSAKMDRLVELVKEVVANGEKCTIFSTFSKVANVIYNKMFDLGYNPSIITGDIKNRQEQVDYFQNDPSCKVIVGTIGAMGTGLTLTAATTCIFIDSAWTKALNDQAEDRQYRLGTTKSVNIIYLITKDTIDERVFEIVENKGNVSDMLIDMKYEKCTPELLHYLLH